MTTTTTTRLVRPGRRSALALVVLAALLTAGVLAPPAHAGPAVRSGSILVSARPTYALGPWAGCRGIPSCLAWQVSCEPAVATRDGAAASIVNVRSLAGSPTARTFRVVDGQAAVIGVGVDVEFWSASCNALDGGFSDSSTAQLTIPARAAWMTVTAPCAWIGSALTGVRLRWELR